MVQSVVGYVWDELELFSKNNKTNFLFHYTNLEALKSILDYSEIRFSDCKYLNDSSEVSHGLDKVRDLLNKKLNEYKNSKIKKRSNENKLLRLFGKISSLSPGFAKHYIFCLCEKTDLLSQWKGYSKDSLPIELRFKVDQIGLLSNCPDTFLFKVIYDERKQNEIVENVVKKYLEFESKSKKEIENNLFSATLGLYLATIFFKHHGFQEEQEWRFMHIHYPKFKHKKETHFNYNKMFLLPYKIFKFNELFPNSIGNPIQEIRVGPQRNALSRDSIREYLTIKKIDIPVTYSQIPYRT